MKSAVLFVLILASVHVWSQEIESIALGSCSHEYDPNQMWPYVLENDPDLWIWLGDIIYGDSSDPNVLQTKYDRQKSHPEYQKLMAATPVIGIWDDHDYGVNDGGKEFSGKRKSKTLLQKFLDVPEDNPVYRHEGAYNSYLFGKGADKIKVILLDTRYFRDPLKANPAGDTRYLPNEKGDILGEQQWGWLEKELTNSDARIHLICSGIQIIPTEQGYEKWANFPAARKRLFDLIERTKPRGAILLSGDRHIAEFSKVNLDQLPYPLYEFTSSGLTHTWNNPRQEPNQYRVENMIIEKNFGMIRFSWDDSIEVTFEIRGTDNKLFQSFSFEL